MPASFFSARVLCTRLSRFVALIILVVVRLAVGICREYVAYHGKSLEQRLPSVANILRKEPLNFVFEGKLALDVSNHWAYQDKVVDAVMLLKATKQGGQAAGKINRLRQMNLETAKDQTSALAQAFFPDSSPEDANRMMEIWQVQNPMGDIQLKQVFKSVIDSRILRMAEREIKKSGKNAEDIQADNQANIGRIQRAPSETSAGPTFERLNSEASSKDGAKPTTPGMYAVKRDTSEDSGVPPAPEGNAPLPPSDGLSMA